MLVILLILRGNLSFNDVLTKRFTRKEYSVQSLTSLIRRALYALFSGLRFTKGWRRFIISMC